MAIEVRERLVLRIYLFVMDTYLTNVDWDYWGDYTWSTFSGGNAKGGSRVISTGMTRFSILYRAI